MNNPKISVIIPTYNRGYSIARAIKCVLKQTFQDFEIIIVDDGSQDSTEEVVGQFKDTRIRYLAHSQNKGEPAARNTGVMAAKGEYIAFLDSDDEWLPNKLEIQLNIHEQITDEISASCTGYYLHLTKLGIILNKIPQCTGSSWYRHLLLFGCDLGPGTTMVVTKQAYHEVGYYDESLIRSPDWDWLIRYVKKYKLTVVEELLAHVYYNNSKNPHVFEKSSFHFMTKYDKELMSFGWFRRNQRIARSLFRVAEAYYLDKNFIKGSLVLLKALSLNPIQHPGMYVLVFDSFFGTSLARPAYRLLDWFENAK